MGKAPTRAEIESILASMNRSADALQCASRTDTVRGAQRNIWNCGTWLKERSIAYYYDFRRHVYKLEVAEVESENNQT